MPSRGVAPLSIRTFTTRARARRSSRTGLSLTLSSLVVLSRQGSTRKKLAAASGAILEYVGPVAIMAGNRDERQRCWDYLNWLLKQRRGPLSVSPKGRDDVTEFKIPRGSAGRLQGKRAENLRSIERETKTFCFITEAKDVGVDDRDELMLIFGADRNKRFKALDLMEDALAGRYRPVPMGGRGGGRGGGRDRRDDRPYGPPQGQIPRRRPRRRRGRPRPRRRSRSKGRSSLRPPQGQIPRRSRPWTVAASGRKVRSSLSARRDERMGGRATALTRD